MHWLFTGSGEITFVCGGAVLSMYVSHTTWLYTNTGCVQILAVYNYPGDVIRWYSCNGAVGIQLWNRIILIIQPADIQ